MVTLSKCAMSASLNRLDRELARTRKPDGQGTFNPRCQHIIDHPRGETEPRQCLRAATRGDRFCDTPGHNGDAR